MVFGNEGEVHSKFKMEKIVLSKNGRSKYELILGAMLAGL